VKNNEENVSNNKTKLDNINKNEGNKLKDKAKEKVLEKEKLKAKELLIKKQKVRSCIALARARMIEDKV